MQVSLTGVSILPSHPWDPTVLHFTELDTVVTQQTKSEENDRFYVAFLHSFFGHSPSMQAWVFFFLKTNVFYCFFQGRYSGGEAPQFFSVWEHLPPNWGRYHSQAPLKTSSLMMVLFSSELIKSFPLMRCCFILPFAKPQFRLFQNVDFYFLKWLMQ